MATTGRVQRTAYGMFVQDGKGAEDRITAPVEPWCCLVFAEAGLHDAALVARMALRRTSRTNYVVGMAVGWRRPWEGNSLRRPRRPPNSLTRRPATTR